MRAMIPYDGTFTAPANHYRTSKSASKPIQTNHTITLNENLVIHIDAEIRTRTKELWRIIEIVNPHFPTLILEQNGNIQKTCQNKIQSYATYKRKPHKRSSNWIYEACKGFMLYIACERGRDSSFISHRV